MQYKEEPGQLKEPVSLVPEGRYLEESTGVRSLAVAEVAEVWEAVSVICCSTDRGGLPVENIQNYAA